MADQKKRGFHALEERIHQMEEEDARREREASTQQNQEAPRSAPSQRDEEQRQRK